jgi:hypothetical protein
MKIQISGREGEKNEKERRERHAQGHGISPSAI